MNDYQKTITINKPTSEVYAAITGHIKDWWSNDLTGAATHTGDSFTISFNKTSKTMDITEAIPGKQVIWTCVKAYIDMPTLQNKSEWVGTRMIWTLHAAGQGTTLSFAHEGLNKSFACYTICEAGWNNFLGSLHDYLSTGKGRPFLKSGEKEVREERTQPVAL